MPARRTPSLLVAAAAVFAALGCRSARDEGLAILEVSMSSDLPRFGKIRFSVDDRPTVVAREIAYDPAKPLRFGYYVPGPSGTVFIRATAIAPPHCTVGEGIATATVEVGKVSKPVALAIARVKITDPACLASSDGSVAEDGDSDGESDRPGEPPDGGEDGPGDPPDVAPDVASDVASDMGPDSAGDAADGGPGPVEVAPPRDTGPPPPPACLTAVQHCPGAAACCPSLRCGNTTAGQVCCGDFNAGCSRPGGEDCCGSLECFHGRCCLPPVYFCGGHEGECCEGRICGNTSAGRVCCGLAGAGCSRPGGEDCCGNLECRNGRCG